MLGGIISDQRQAMRAGGGRLAEAQKAIAMPGRCYHHPPALEVRGTPLSTGRVKRRLTAILAADVAGYSRLTGLDEEGTHVQLQDHLRSLVEPKIAEHRGRVVKTGGGVLLEFPFHRPNLDDGQICS